MSYDPTNGLRSSGYICTVSPFVVRSWCQLNSNFGSRLPIGVEYRDGRLNRCGHRNDWQLCLDEFPTDPFVVAEGVSFFDSLGDPDTPPISPRSPTSRTSRRRGGGTRA